ncbi:MAG: MlaD family protein [Candidatus Latescibacteria bacterium]|jgi:phospholipid/cholesterol/gamma-HCH transport system substrate-binding protein|nr:MlaD family protein [Candidatus Latescibacterota bacterium]
MRSREREVILGAVVFAALVILVIGSMVLSERFAGAAGGYKLVVAFDTVSGLKRGDSVTVRGVKVGKVLEVRLEEGRPRVVIGFEDIRGLPRDSRIYLKGVGMMGEQMVEVEMGSANAVYAHEDRVEGIAAGGLAELTANAADIANHLRRAVDVMATPENLTRIETILTQMDTSTATLQSILEENRAVIARTLDSLNAASSGVSGVVDDNREKVAEAVENLRQTTGRLSATVEGWEAASVSLRETLQDVRDVAGKLRDGKGTLGLLLNDEGLYRDLRRTLTSLDSLVSDVKENPKRYFDFSIF